MSESNGSDCSQDKLRRDYVRAVILIHEIDRCGACFDEAINVKDVGEAFRLLRSSLVGFGILNASLPGLSVYGKDSEEVAALANKLKTQLPSLNHMRNRIAGHLDDEVIETAIKWGPDLFAKNTIGTDGFHVLAYKYLIETAINSYVANENASKVVGGEIDLFYPPNYEEFMGAMANACKNAIDYLGKIKDIISSKLQLFTDEELVRMAIIAGGVDFRLKGKGR